MVVYTGNLRVHGYYLQWCTEKFAEAVPIPGDDAAFVLSEPRAARNSWERNVIERYIDSILNVETVLGNKAHTYCACLSMTYLT